MAKHVSSFTRPAITQLSLLANDWHRCERFERRGVQCPYRTADIEKDDPDERHRRLALPARKRQAVNEQKDVGDTERVLDITKIIDIPKPLPPEVGVPAPPEPIPFPVAPKPTKEMPKPETIPEPVAAIGRLPDGMPVVNPGGFTGPIPAGLTHIANNPAFAGDLVKWMATKFNQGMATKPAISLPTPAPPSKLKPSTQGALPVATSLENYIRKAASAEEIFAKDFASSMIPARDLEKQLNTNTSRQGPNKKQIATAAAAAAAGATAATIGMRRGGGRSGGGLQFKSVFSPTGEMGLQP